MMHGNHWWMHENHWWGMGWMWIFWIAVLVGIVLLVVWLVRTVQVASPQSRSDESPEEILKKRLARGEIDHTEYEAKLKELHR